MVIYVLYLAGLALGVPLIIGAALTHLRVFSTRGWMCSHHRWQIRTFWYLIVWLAITLPPAYLIRSGYIVTTSFRIKYELTDYWGYGPAVLDMDEAVMLFFGLFAWFVYRNVRGLLLWSKQRPAPACDFND